MDIVDTYKALADHSRLRLIAALARGRFNVGELTSALEMRQPTVSHHLKILIQTGIADNQREGTWAYYSLKESSEENLASTVINQCLKLLDSEADPELYQQIAADRAALSAILSNRRDRALDYFETVAPKWSDLRKGAVSSEEYLSILEELLTPDGSLLELGCGTGTFLSKILPRSGPTIGVDYSQAMLQQCRTNLGELSDQVDLRLGYIEHLPVGDDSIDIALAHMVLHHIAKPEEALLDIFRVLRPGGTLLVVDLLAHKNEYMREQFADLWLGFEPKQLGAMVSQLGFDQSRIEILGERDEVFLLRSVKPPVTHIHAAQ